MPRDSIMDIGRPPKLFRPSCVVFPEGEKGFESDEAASREAQFRAKAMNNNLLLKPKQRTAAADLARRLMFEDSECSPTPASPLTMRKYRDIGAGWLWKLIENEGYSKTARFVTILLPQWSLTAKQLKKFDPRRILRALLTDLYRVGAKKADGFFVAFIHGEFDERTHLFQIHLHGIVAGGMIEVLKNLKKRPKYKSERPGGKRREPHRVHLKKVPLTNLPSPLTYIMQSFWPNRISIVRPDGTIRRERQKGRVPEPWHCLYLLWLDQWELKDLRLLVKVRPSKEGFRLQNG